MASEYTLINDLRRMNEDFRKRLTSQQKFSNDKKRKLIEEHIGSFTSTYKDFSFKKVFAVDGSNNSFGENYPFIIHFLKSGAYGSGNKKYDMSSLLYLSDKETRRKMDELMDSKNIDENTAYDYLKKQEVAKLEVKMGIELIKNEKPDLILFDGGLLRYKKFAEDEFAEYEELAYEHKVVTAGVIEDIGTFLISKTLQDLGVEFYPFQFDREVLYGLLKIGESLIVKNDLKFKDDINTAFARFSNDPNPIGIDLFHNDINYLDEVLSLVQATTNYNGRGIPVLIDKVDEFVKIKNEMVEQLMLNYVDRDILELYFTAKRRKR